MRCRCESFGALYCDRSVNCRGAGALLVRRGVWSQLLHHLPKIRTIRVLYAFPGKLINLLAGGVEHTMESSSPAVVLPQLRTLWLTEVNFCFCTPQFFLACLQYRAQVDSAIQDLNLQGCLCLYEPEVEIMKEFVQDVEWDGIEEYDSDNYEWNPDDSESEEFIFKSPVAKSIRSRP